MAVGEQAIVTNAMESIRQDVEQEAADELANRQPHDLASSNAILTIILPAKTDMLVREIEQPAVGDGYTVRIARKISQDLARACERTLGENDPFLRAQGSEVGLKYRPVTERNEIVEELQVAST